MDTKWCWYLRCYSKVQLLWPSQKSWTLLWKLMIFYVLFIGQQHVLNCLKEIGFSNECAKIWQYNIKHTKAECFSVCIWAWITNEPFNKPDGSLRCVLSRYCPVTILKAYVTFFWPVMTVNSIVAKTDQLPKPLVVARFF